MSSTELATSAAPVVAVRGDELSVSAATPNEMAQSQEALIEWAKRKVALTTAEADELGSAFKEAKKRKWKSTTLLRHYRLALQRVEFYKKLLSALEHGYIIVPTFPVDVFAYRTDKDKPKGLYVSSYDYGWRTNGMNSMKQETKPMPAGEGEYQNPFPAAYRRVIATGPNEQKRIAYDAVHWNELEFPMAMAKPNIMQATDRAMMLKIFDEFGVLPDRNQRRVDPVIVGRILAPKKHTHEQKRFISFIIAWHLDTATL